MWGTPHQSGATVASGGAAATVPAPPESATRLADSDAAALRRVLAATAQPGVSRTGRLMPNAAPPPPRTARRRAAAATKPATGEPPRPRGSRSSVAAAPVGVPTSWAGFGALLAAAGERAPQDALALANIIAAAEDRPARVDLSGMWATPADLAPVRSRSVLRALDEKGRLQLPVTVEAKCEIPVERDGAVVTVFLPGSPDAPRPNYAAAPLPLYPGGRLTLTAGIRRQAGIGHRADVIALFDEQRLTVTLTAASRLDAALTTAVDALRRAPAATAGTADGPPYSRAHRDHAEDVTNRRLRILA